MGWNGDNGEIISKAPTRQYREGFDAINWSKPKPEPRCDCGAELIRPPSKDYPYGYCYVCHSGQRDAMLAVKPEIKMIPTPEHLKGTIYDQDGETEIEILRGRGPTIKVEDYTPADEAREIDAAANIVTPQTFAGFHVRRQS